MPKTAPIGFSVAASTLLQERYARNNGRNSKNIQHFPCASGAKASVAPFAARISKPFAVAWSRVEVSLRIVPDCGNHASAWFGHTCTSSCRSGPSIKGRLVASPGDNQQRQAASVATFSFQPKRVWSYNHDMKKNLGKSSEQHLVEITITKDGDLVHTFTSQPFQLFNAKRQQLSRRNMLKTRKLARSTEAAGAQQASGVALHSAMYNAASLPCMMGAGSMSFPFLPMQVATAAAAAASMAGSSSSAASSTSTAASTSSVTSSSSSSSSQFMALPFNSFMLPMLQAAPGFGLSAAGSTAAAQAAHAARMAMMAAAAAPLYSAAYASMLPTQAGTGTTTTTPATATATATTVTTTKSLAAAPSSVVLDIDGASTVSSASSVASNAGSHAAPPTTVGDVAAVAAAMARQ